MNCVFRQEYRKMRGKAVSMWEVNGGDVILETEHLCYSYDQGRKLRFQDVNVSVRKGERIAVLGSNGAGKSTCFLNLNGVLTPDSRKNLIPGD